MKWHTYLASLNAIAGVAIQNGGLCQARDLESDIGTDEGHRLLNNDTAPTDGDGGVAGGIPDDVYHCLDPLLYVNSTIGCDAETHEWDIDALQEDAPPLDMCGPAEGLQYDEQQIASLPDSQEPCLIWWQTFGDDSESSNTPEEAETSQPSVKENDAPATAPSTTNEEALLERSQEFSPFTLILEFSGSATDASSAGLVLDRTELLLVTYRHILETLQAKVFYYIGVTDGGDASISTKSGQTSRTAIEDIDFAMTSTRLTVNPNPTLYEAVTGMAIFVAEPLVITQEKLDQAMQEAFSGDAMDLYMLRLKLSRDGGLQRISGVEWRTGTGNSMGPPANDGVDSDPAEDPDADKDGEDGKGDENGNASTSTSSSNFFDDLEWTSTSMIVIVCSVSVAVLAICVAGCCLLYPRYSHRRRQQQRRQRREAGTDRGINNSRSTSVSRDSRKHRKSRGVTGTSLSMSSSSSSSEKPRRGGKTISKSRGRDRPHPIKTSGRGAKHGNPRSLDDDTVEHYNLKSPGYEGEEFVDSDDIENQSLANNSLYSYGMGGTISGMVLEDDASLSIAPSILYSIDERRKPKRSGDTSHEFRDGDDDNDDYLDGNHEGNTSNRNGGSEDDGTPKISPVWSIMSQLQQHFGGGDSDDSREHRLAGEGDDGRKRSPAKTTQHGSKEAAARPPSILRNPSATKDGNSKDRSKLERLLASNVNVSLGVDDSRNSSEAMFLDTDDSNSLVSDYGVSRVLDLGSATNAGNRQTFQEIWNGHGDGKKMPPAIARTPSKSKDRAYSPVPPPEDMLKTVRKSNVQRSAPAHNHRTGSPSKSTAANPRGALAMQDQNRENGLTATPVTQSGKAHSRSATATAATAKHQGSPEQKNRVTGATSPIEQDQVAVVSSVSAVATGKNLRQSKEGSPSRSLTTVSLSDNTNVVKTNHSQDETYSVASSFASTLPSPLDDESVRTSPNDRGTMVGTSLLGDLDNKLDVSDDMSTDDFDDVNYNEDSPSVPTSGSDLSGQENRSPEIADENTKNVTTKHGGGGASVLSPNRTLSTATNGSEDAAPRSVRKKTSTASWQLGKPVALASPESFRSDQSGKSSSHGSHSSSKSTNSASLSLLKSPAHNRSKNEMAKDSASTLLLSATLAARANDSPNSSDSDCYVEESDDEHGEESNATRPPTHPNSSKRAVARPKTRQMTNHQPAKNIPAVDVAPSTADSYAMFADPSADYDNLSVRSDGAGTVDGSITSYDPNSNYRWDSATMASF
mmetsp:Transcript_7983/g.22935  ORF Transcript_7983/g.22935 Transcript_7983/m.22935 type:complete len:1254 (+) Transcript_7983:120-3881(+)|eukprot:CAMPEP_0119566256 /NCGR_PEP_ID=MMETSP1352-20130426/32561_1 /TAXON_ID=265584 /ORGANISM="Stauroneis constricta, Strain CCMP1120" /LENGTH=1253 /DNA_ID=CAMNT_0007615327 /DNA_START=8 /DNA_END=3769 /DNA_ORIENTATION=+